MANTSFQSTEVETLSRRIMMLKFLASEKRSFSNAEIRSYLTARNHNVSLRTVHADLVMLSHALPAVAQAEGNRTMWHYEDASHLLSDCVETID